MLLDPRALEAAAAAAVKIFARFLPILVVAFSLTATGLAVLMFRNQAKLASHTNYAVSWALHKGSLEVTLLLERLKLFTLGLDGVTRDDIDLRYEIVFSRLHTMSHGEVGNYMHADPSRREILHKLAATLAETDGMIPNIEDRNVANALHDRLLPYGTLLTNLAANALAADAALNARRWNDVNVLRAQFQVVAIGLALSSMMLAWKTVRQQRRISDTNRQLRRLADQSTASAAEFQDALASLSDGLILWDPQDRISTWNSRCEEIVPSARMVLRPGLSFTDYLRQSIAINHPDWSDEMRTAHIAERTRQHDHRGSTGLVATLEDRIIEVRENPTSNGGCITIFRDITAERSLLDRLMRNEAELQRALAAEREINAQQRQFVSMASHEFKTPLAIIDSASQRILAPGADLPTRVDRIRSAVARMVEIIDRTLSTAQLDEGRVNFVPTRCDLRAILAEVRERQLSIAQRFTIALDLPPGDLALDADARLLEQVFTNLVSNAIKYSGSSTRVEITVRASYDTLGVSVRDFGLGIPRNEIDRLFTRFYRASTTLTIPGTGIGLHLVKQFVALHGGDVSVTSEAAKGSIFTVILPRRRQVARPSRAVA